MTIKEIIEWDLRNFERLKKLQLPYHYKLIGFWAAAIILISLFSLKAIEGEPDWIRTVLKNLFIVSLLIVSLSKEKIEDEYMYLLRSQSYRLALIFGVFYIVVQPYITYSIEMLFQPDKASLETSAFQAIAVMLIMQLTFFRLLKNKCAQ